jgi:hypothetical protein
MKPDGSGMVCDGVSRTDKNTCSTFRKLPPRLVDHFREMTAREDQAEKQ